MKRHKNTGVQSVSCLSNAPFLHTWLAYVGLCDAFLLKVAICILDPTDLRQ